MSRDDRAALLGYFGAGFAELKKTYDVEQFQFHKAPAFSFLRVHQPAKFGDDLSSFRKTVVEANTQAQDGARPRGRPGGPRHSRRRADRACRQAGRLGRVRPVVRAAILREFQEEPRRRYGVSSRRQGEFRGRSAARWASRPSTPSANTGTPRAASSCCARANSAPRRWRRCSARSPISPASRSARSRS